LTVEGGKKKEVCEILKKGKKGGGTGGVKTTGERKNLFHLWPKTGRRKKKKPESWEVTNLTIKYRFYEKRKGFHWKKRLSTTTNGEE